MKIKKVILIITTIILMLMLNNTNVYAAVEHGPSISERINGIVNSIVLIILIINMISIAIYLIKSKSSKNEKNKKLRTWIIIVFSLCFILRFIASVIIYIEGA